MTGAYNHCGETLAQVVRRLTQGASIVCKSPISYIALPAKPPRKGKRAKVGEILKSGVLVGMDRTGQTRG
jgi:hypothetical protein